MTLHGLSVVVGLQNHPKNTGWDAFWRSSGVSSQSVVGTVLEPSTQVGYLMVEWARGTWAIKHAELRKAPGPHDASRKIGFKWLGPIPPNAYSYGPT